MREKRIHWVLGKIRTTHWVRALPQLKNTDPIKKNDEDECSC